MKTQTTCAADPASTSTLEAGERERGPRAEAGAGDTNTMTCELDNKLEGAGTETGGNLCLVTMSGRTPPGPRPWERPALNFAPQRSALPTWSLVPPRPTTPQHNTIRTINNPHTQRPLLYTRPRVR